MLVYYYYYNLHTVTRDFSIIEFHFLAIRPQLVGTSPHYAGSSNSNLHSFPCPNIRSFITTTVTTTIVWLENPADSFQASQGAQLRKLFYETEPILISSRAKHT